MALGTLSLLFFGCGLLEQEDSQIAIEVGSSRITVDALKRDMVFISAGMDIPAQQREQIRDRLIEQVIDHYLIIEYGKDRDISLSAQETERAMQSMTGEYSKEALEEALLRGSVELEQWKTRVKERLLVKKILTKVTEALPVPSSEDLKRYYADHPTEFRSPPRVKFRQIVIRTREEAEELLERLRKGEAMVVLARQYSIGPEAENGGEVGWIARGQLEESMEEALFSLPTGKFSHVTRTPYGYHIFEVLDVQSKGLRALTEVLDEIEAKVLYQRRESFYKEWIKGLRARYAVKVHQKILHRLEFS